MIPASWHRKRLHDPQNDASAQGSFITDGCQIWSQHAQLRCCREKYIAEQMEKRLGKQQQQEEADSTEQKLPLHPEAGLYDIPRHLQASPDAAVWVLWVRAWGFGSMIQSLPSLLQLSGHLLFERLGAASLAPTSFPAQQCSSRPGPICGPVMAADSDKLLLVLYTAVRQAQSS